MSAFLEPHQVDRLGKAWSDIASLAPQLDDVIATNVIGTPSSLGIRIAHAPASRPPVNLAAIECLNLLHVCVTGWTRCLLDDALVEIPADITTRGLARHLHVNADRIAGCMWALDCLMEAEDLAVEARRIVEPDGRSTYLGPCQADGPPLCRGLFLGDGRDGFCRRCETEFSTYAVRAATEERIRVRYRSVNGTPMELSRKLRDLGYPITNKQITYWARRKLIVQRGEISDGPRLSPLYNLGEVEDAFYRTGGISPDERVESH